MNARPTFPIRLKILLTLLVVVTTVVSIITYSMAGVFHKDKKEYIHDLTSLIAMSTSEECRSLLSGYGDRLHVYGQAMATGNLPQKYRTELLTTYLQESRELVGLVLYEGSRETASIFDTASLEAGGLTSGEIREDFEVRPVPFEELEAGRPVVENRTLRGELPMFALAVPLDPAKDGTPRSILALLRLDSLQRLSSRSDVFEVFLVDRNSVLLAHPDPEMLRRPTTFSIPEGLRGHHFSAGITREFVDRGTEMIGGYASPNFGGVTAGVQIPRTAAFIASREIFRQLTTVALLLLVGAATIGLIGSRRLTRPVEQLVEATRKIGRGEFDIKVGVTSRDEIGMLSDSFNRMAAELEARDQALENAQKQLIQSEKMAAFGQLGAGMAHEVKNPLAGILACAQLSLRRVDDGTPVQRNLRLIERETKRCKNIVDNVLRFARQEKAVLERTLVNPVVDDAVAIVNYQLEQNSVEVDFEGADELPAIRANANQLQQVLINLMMNAQQAMGEAGGTVTVRTEPTDSGDVCLSVRDDGPGIPEGIRESIFEPFFTTKPNGQGTGLGLSVSYGIVTDHGGRIVVESEPGAGACFRMTFPAMPPVARPGATRTSEPERASPSMKA